MSGVTVGEQAPAFRLPSGQGPEIGPEDFRGRNHLIIWFTKGMICPFCRQQMSQLARGYPRFQALQAEILQVTPATPERVRQYVQKFGIPFPYLSDADREVRRTYGVERRARSLAGYVHDFVAGATSTKPPSDFAQFPSPLTDLPVLLADDDMGFFIVDRAGLIRYALAGTYATPTGNRAIPSNDDILRELERCEQVGAERP